MNTDILQGTGSVYNIYDAFKVWLDL